MNEKLDSNIPHNAWKTLDDLAREMYEGDSGEDDAEQEDQEQDAQDGSSKAPPRPPKSSRTPGKDRSGKRPHEDKPSGRGSSPVPQNVQRQLNEIRYYASWGTEEGRRKRDVTSELLLKRHPHLESEIAEQKRLGQIDRDLQSQAYQLPWKRLSDDKIARELARLRASVPGEDGRYKMVVAGRIRNSYEAGKASHERVLEETSNKRKGMPPTIVTPPSPVSVPRTVFPHTTIVPRPNDRLRTLAQLHPNDIRAQKPRTGWQLVIDESGAIFDEQAERADKVRLGRFVGILVPEGESPLPGLPQGWHAVKQNLAGIDSAVSAVLKAGVGVFGIDVNSLPVTPGERWLDGVALLVDWVIRLLPLDGRTHIEVLVENRGSFIANQPWDVVKRDCLRRNALAFPARAANIDLDIRVIDKQQTSLNGYVDALAFTWARSSDPSKARLKQSGLSGTCLLNSHEGIDSRSMLHAWDAFAQGVNLPTDKWWSLIGMPDAAGSSSIVSALLWNIGEEALADRSVWSGFLNEVKARMAASPVDLRKLALAVDWLQAYQPEGAGILPRMRLVWLTVQLARANHLGMTEQAWMTEMESIASSLIEECAPLVCHADLHVAVNATNRFDFDSAEKAMARWIAQPPEVPGLQYWAQARSTMGQLAAFRGDSAGAMGFFKEALAAFARLSDPEERRSNELQTGCYLAIAMMDSGPADGTDVRDAVEMVTGKLPAAASRLAVSDNQADRYAHHLLLRWIAASGDCQGRDEYLKQQPRWFSGEGHPWPLIMLYRGILLKEAGKAEEAVRHAVEGAKLAFSAEQGPTVRFIGCACMAAAVSWGASWPEGRGIIEALRKELPLASNRIDQLERELGSKGDAIEMLRALLPFNFR